MRKYRQGELKALVKDGAAVSLNNYGFAEMRDFLQSHTLDKIGYSSGVYDINGGLLKDTETGKLYAITARNTALMMAF